MNKKGIVFFSTLVFLGLATNASAFGMTGSMNIDTTVNSNNHAGNMDINVSANGNGDNATAKSKNEVNIGVNTSGANNADASANTKANGSVQVGTTGSNIHINTDGTKIKVNLPVTGNVKVESDSKKGTSAKTNGTFRVKTGFDAKLNTRSDSKNENNSNGKGVFNFEVTATGDSNNENENSDVQGEFKGESKVVIDGDTVFVNNEKADVEVSVNTAKSTALETASADSVVDVKAELGENNEINYVVKTSSKGKFLGLFEFNINSNVKVSANTGAVIEVDKPWYSFLVF